MPACCSPLNGVTTGVFAPGSQPRLNGVRGLLNHSPRWYWWVGGKVAVPPGETEKVSELKMPRTVALPVPCRPTSTSLWYQAIPNGLFGCWMTNRSKPEFGGMPCKDTVMVSLSEPVVMVTRPPACGRQETTAADRTRLNENERSGLGRVAAPAAVTPTIKATAPAAAVAASTRRWTRAEK